MVTRRQQEMMDIAISLGRVSIAELAERLDVSQMTAYRDADRLAELGIVQRVRGGITAQPSSIFESSLEYRAHVYQTEKEAVSRACLSMIESGMSVMIDDGTTLLPLVRRLKERTPLTVITAFLPAVSLLTQISGINLVVLGGSYRRHYDSLGGVLSADMIAQLRADLLFMSPSAIDDGVALHQEEDMVATKRAMLASSDRRILVADHSKLGRRATHRLARVEDFDAVVVDDRADAEALAHVLDRGTTVHLAPTSRTAESDTLPA